MALSHLDGGGGGDVHDSWNDAAARTVLAIETGLQKADCVAIPYLYRRLHKPKDGNFIGAVTYALPDGMTVASVTSEEAQLLQRRHVASNTLIACYDQARGGIYVSQSPVSLQNIYDPINCDAIWSQKEQPMFYHGAIQAAFGLDRVTATTDATALKELVQTVASDAVQRSFQGQQHPPLTARVTCADTKGCVSPVARVVALIGETSHAGLAQFKSDVVRSAMLTVAAHTLNAGIAAGIVVTPVDTDRESVDKALQSRELHPYTIQLSDVFLCSFLVNGFPFLVELRIEDDDDTKADFVPLDAALGVEADVCATTTCRAFGRILSEMHIAHDSAEEEWAAHIASLHPAPLQQPNEAATPVLKGIFLPPMLTTKKGWIPNIAVSPRQRVVRVACAAINPRWVVPFPILASLRPADHVLPPRVAVYVAHIQSAKRFRDAVHHPSNDATRDWSTTLKTLVFEHAMHGDVFLFHDHHVATLVCSALAAGRGNTDDMYVSIGKHYLSMVETLRASQAKADELVAPKGWTKSLAKWIQIAVKASKPDVFQEMDNEEAEIKKVKQTFTAEELEQLKAARPTNRFRDVLKKAGEDYVHLLLTQAVNSTYYHGASNVSLFDIKFAEKSDPDCVYGWDVASHTVCVQFQFENDVADTEKLEFATICPHRVVAPGDVGRIRYLPCNESVAPSNVSSSSLSNTLRNGIVSIGKNIVSDKVSANMTISFMTTLALNIFDITRDTLSLAVVDPSRLIVSEFQERVFLSWRKNEPGPTLTALSELLGEDFTCVIMRVCAFEWRAAPCRKTR